MRDSSRVAGSPAAARACTIVCARTGWAVTRHVTLTAAYVDVGSVATRGGQRGGGASGRSLPAEQCQRRGEAICRRRHGASLWRAGGYPPHYCTFRRTHVADPRIKAIFAEHDLVRLQRTLVENLQRATRNARSACFLRRAEPGAGQAGTDGTRCDRALTAARRPGADISRIEGGELP